MDLNKEQLQNYIERIEKLEVELTDLKTDVREIFKHAKGDGWDVKIIREVLKQRKKDKDQIEEEETLLKTYMKLLGGI